MPTALRLNYLAETGRNRSYYRFRMVAQAKRSGCGGSECQIGDGAVNESILVNHLMQLYVLWCCLCLSLFLSI